MLRNSPTALRLLKCALNAADDGHAGIQVPLLVSSLKPIVAPGKEHVTLWQRQSTLTYVLRNQELGGNATMLFYQSEEGNEVSSGAGGDMRRG